MRFSQHKKQKRQMYVRAGDRYRRHDNIFTREGFEHKTEPSKGGNLDILKSKLSSKPGLCFQNGDPQGMQFKSKRITGNPPVLKSAQKGK